MQTATTTTATTTTTTPPVGWGVRGEDIFEAAPVYGRWDRVLHYMQWDAVPMQGGKMTEASARDYAAELNRREARAPLSTLH